jgi:hypothetical protein
MLDAGFFDKPDLFFKRIQHPDIMPVVQNTTWMCIKSDNESFSTGSHCHFLHLDEQGLMPFVNAIKRSDSYHRISEHSWKV